MPLPGRMRACSGKSPPSEAVSGAQAPVAFTTTRAAGGTAKGLVGIAMSANVANQYGWYCIFGRCVVTIAADVSADLAAYGAAAGVLADDVVATKQIAGMMLLEGLNAGGSAIPGTSNTTAANTTIAFMQYPVAILAV
mgnify:CR=1 FL=1